MAEDKKNNQNQQPKPKSNEPKPMAYQEHVKKSNIGESIRTDLNKSMTSDKPPVKPK